MAMVTGQGTCLQLGKETTWGTKVTPTVAINHTSEAFRLVVDRTEEDSLIGGATSSSMDIQKKSVEFSWEQLAKPENIGFVLAMALGTEGSAAVVESGSDAYKHEFTLLQPGVNASLPKFSAIIDRHVAVKAYTGCKIGSLGISCAAGDYMRISVSGVGKDEEAGTKVSSVIVPNLKAFRFAGGTVTFDGVEFGDVTSINWNLDNALDEGEQTTGSGYYGTEPEPQKRAVTLSLESFYNSATETMREAKYKTEAECDVSLKFESPSFIEDGTPYSIQIDMPHLTVTECDPVIAGAEKTRLTISGTACETSNDEAVTITLIDSKNAKYA